MKINSKIRILFVTSLITMPLLGCNSKSAGVTTNIPKNQLTDLSMNYIDDSYKNYYQTLVYSFSDSNGDGIGDLNGLINRLDYLKSNEKNKKSLGVDGLYLLPIFKSNSYHKYDVIDYKSIDPQYGTFDDFKRLITECNNRGISIILDLPINHSSSANKWFIQSKNAMYDLTESDVTDNNEITEAFKAQHPYLDYYNWVHKSNIPAAGNFVKSIGDWYYEAYFDSGMPDLNLDNVKVQNEIKSILKFWFDLGVYGFRLDGVEHYFDNSLQKNFEFCNKLDEWCKEIKGNDPYYLVGEGPWSEKISEYYNNTNIQSFMNFYFGNYDTNVLGDRSVINNIFIQESLYSLKMGISPEDYEVDEYGDLYSDGKLSQRSTSRNMESIINHWNESSINFKDNAINANFLTNHDTIREATAIRQQRLYTDDEEKLFTSINEQRLKMAWAISHLMSGTTFTYYGEEIGMATGTQYDYGSNDGNFHNDPNKRHPMYWSDTNKADTVNIYKIPGAEECEPYLAPADQQINENNSVWNFFREMFQMKKYYPEIARGREEVLYAKNNITVVKKTYKDSSIYLVYNIGRDEGKLSLNELELDNTQVQYVLTTDQTYSCISKSQLYLPDYSVTIIK